MTAIAPRTRQCHSEPFEHFRFQNHGRAGACFEIAWNNDKWQWTGRRERRRIGRGGRGREMEWRNDEDSRGSLGFICSYCSSSIFWRRCNCLTWTCLVRHHCSIASVIGLLEKVAKAQKNFVCAGYVGIIWMAKHVEAVVDWNVIHVGRTGDFRDCERWTVRNQTDVVLNTNTCSANNNGAVPGRDLPMDNVNDC